MSLLPLIKRAALCPAAPLVLLLVGLLAPVAVLSAEPKLRIESLDVGEYPFLKARVRLSLPAGSQAEPGSEQFSAQEFLGRREVPAGIVESSVVAAENQGLRLVLLIDATRSVPPRAFRRSLRAAVRLVEGLGPSDRVAVYSLNGRAHLRSDFGESTESTKSSIRRIRRDGRVTKIYDALEVAVKRARSVAVEAGKLENGPARSAVVLFTDGRDEGSLISVEECSRLAILPGDTRVPVSTVLYGRRANSRKLNKLAELTGGQLIRGLAAGDLSELLQKVRRLPVQVRTLRLRSDLSRSRSLFPGETVEVLISWADGQSRATGRSSYVVPWEGYIRMSLESPFGWLMLVVAAALILGMVVAIAMALSRSMAAARKTAASAPPAPEIAPAGAVGVPTVSAMPHSSPSEFPHDFERSTEYAPGRQRVAEQTRLSTREQVDRERFSFLQNYSYRILQNALREANRYERAQLVQMDAASGTPLREFDLFLERTVIGSGQWSDIRLADQSVAAVHARIRQVDHRYVIYDLSTGAPTYLNHRKVLRPRALHDGDLLRIGRSTFRFRGA